MLYSKHANPKEMDIAGMELIREIDKVYVLVKFCLAYSSMVKIWSVAIFRMPRKNIPF